MNETADEQARAGLEAAAAGGDSLVGMAMLGKTAAALALILVILLVAAAVLRRWGLPHQRQGRQLRMVASTAVGPKERVVIVQVKDTWLVLGVGGGRVSKLHSLPAEEASAPPEGAGFEAGDGFRTRFAKALKHNAGLGGRGNG